MLQGTFDQAAGKVSLKKVSRHDALLCAGQTAWTKGWNVKGGGMRVGSGESLLRVSERGRERGGEERERKPSLHISLPCPG